MVGRSIKVGYQGTPFSYNESAAKHLMQEFKIENYELIPLETSSNVRDALWSKSVDYGVVAQQNTVGGTVKETNEIFLTDDWVTLHRYILKISHCLFVKNADVPTTSIMKVSSHEQALKQCEIHISKFLGEVERVECTDTAKAATLLSKGGFTEDTAVICSKEAGENAGLHLLAEEVQDHKDNRTEFALIQIREKADSKISLKEKLLRWGVSNDATFQNTIKYTLVFAILFAWPVRLIANTVLPKSLELSLPSAVVLMAGIGLSVILLLNNYRKIKSLELLTGYWVYMDKVSDGVGDDKQSYTIPRAVVIDVANQSLRIRGWICEKPPRPYFEAKEVFHSSTFLTAGSLIYKYSNYSNENDWSFNGIVSLEWNKMNPSDSIDSLSGRYYGFLTNSFGGLLFHRISQDKFKEICPV